MLKQKFYGVDLLRVIACLSVCLFHFCNLSLNNNQTYLGSENDLLKFSNIIWHFMFSFFIISSYILFFSLDNENYRINQYKQFILKRFFRIYPPFFISVVLFLLIQYLFTLNPKYHGIPFQMEWSKLISNLLFCPSLFGHEWYNPIYWTLAIEFQFYFILGLIFPLFNSEKLVNNFLFEVFAMLIVYITIYLDSSVCNFHKQTILSYWDLFYLGFILFRFKSNKISSSKSIFLLGVIHIAIFIHYFYGEHYVIFYVGIISTLIIIFIKQQPKFILKISDISYSFYLTHGFTGGLFLYFTRNVFLDEKIRVLVIFAGVLISIIATLPFYKFTEKPWQKMSHKLRLNPLNYTPK